MTYCIETCNHYLRIALEVLHQRNRYRQGACIVDLTSCHSLYDVLRCVQRNSGAQRFIFIGNSSAVSRVLASLISIESSFSLQQYHEKIRHCPGASYEDVMRLLMAHRSMENFTQRDKTTVYGLLLNDSMNDAARIAGISPKLFYMRVNRLVKLLNMRSSLQVHQFFRDEYHPSFVRRKIHEHRWSSIGLK